MDHACTVYKTMSYLSKRWTIMILLELHKGGDDWKRFSELMKSMKDVTPKMLSERLKELEDEGLVENRVDGSTFPVKSEYRLTPASVDLIRVVHELKMWALEWKIDNEPCKNQDCRICIL
jgi:DNA-binding HxlR family transcriptional regulator